MQLIDTLQAIHVSQSFSMHHSDKFTSIFGYSTLYQISNVILPKNVDIAHFEDIRMSVVNRSHLCPLTDLNSVLQRIKSDDLKNLEPDIPAG